MVAVGGQVQDKRGCARIVVKVWGACNRGNGKSEGTCQGSPSVWDAEAKRKAFRSIGVTGGDGVSLVGLRKELVVGLRLTAAPVWRSGDAMFVMCCLFPPLLHLGHALPLGYL